MSSKKDSRRWRLEAYGAFSCKSFRNFLSNGSSAPNFYIARMSLNSSSLLLAWDYGFRRNLNVREVEDLMHLLAELDCVVLVSSRPDRRRWLLESSENFLPSPYSII